MSLNYLYGMLRDNAIAFFIADIQMFIAVLYAHCFIGTDSRITKRALTTNLSAKLFGSAF